MFEIAVAVEAFIDSRKVSVLQFYYNSGDFQYKLLNFLATTSVKIQIQRYNNA